MTTLFIYYSKVNISVPSRDYSPAVCQLLYCWAKIKRDTHVGDFVEMGR